MTSSQDDTLTWVIGSGGLLGGSLTHFLRRDGRDLYRARPVPWSVPDRSRSVLTDNLRDFLRRADSTGSRWRIAWCAGAGVTGTSAATLTNEVATFAHVIDALTDFARPGSGTLFVASSAGALYAGSAGPPFSEQHRPVPISAYGDAKLALEERAIRFASETGSTVVIGRIANLYGPGQNLQKPQGLISHLCRAHLSRQPLSIYVSLDTIRDYLFVDDCAEMIATAMSIAEGDPGAAYIKNLASHRGVTVAALIGECRRIFKRQPPLVLGTSPNARFQVRDLRVSSVIWPQLDQRVLTTLPAGIAATVASLRRTTQLATC